MFSTAKRERETKVEWEKQHAKTKSRLMTGPPKMHEWILLSCHYYFYLFNTNCQSIRGSIAKRVSHFLSFGHDSNKVSRSFIDFLLYFLFSFLSVRRFLSIWCDGRKKKIKGDAKEESIGNNRQSSNYLFRVDRFVFPTIMMKSHFGNRG